VDEVSAQPLLVPLDERGEGLAVSRLSPFDQAVLVVHRHIHSQRAALADPDMPKTSIDATAERP
jgi:hypothetical protein